MADPTQWVYVIISALPVWASIRPCHFWQEYCCGLGRWSESVLQVCVVKILTLECYESIAFECNYSIYRWGLRELIRTRSRLYSGALWILIASLTKGRAEEMAHMHSVLLTMWCLVTPWVCYNKEIVTTCCILVLQLSPNNLKQISFLYSSVILCYCVTGNRKQVNLTTLISPEKPICNVLWFGCVAWAHCPYQYNPFLWSPWKCLGVSLSLGQSESSLKSDLRLGYYQLLIIWEG